MADRLDLCAASQKHMDRQENQAHRNLIKFKRGKCKTLHLWSNKPLQQHMLGIDLLESRSAEQNLEILVDSKLTMNYKCSAMVQERRPTASCVMLGKAFPIGQER